MESTPACTICGSATARLCIGCRSTTYCTAECQQTDWPVHKQLCRKFQELAASKSRPSPHHYLAIIFPMGHAVAAQSDDVKRVHPKLAWIGSEDLNSTPGSSYFNPLLDEALTLPGQNSNNDDDYIGRHVMPVRRNLLRGRPQNANTLNIWVLDDPRLNNNQLGISTNQCLHGMWSALAGDAYGEKVWKGPIVAVLKKGAGGDPAFLTDMTMTAYRDAIDYLGYYRDTIGSFIDPVGRGNNISHWENLMLRELGGKVRGVRINSPADQETRGEAEMVQVNVPKTHPLFNIESDDPVQIPYLVGKEWVITPYSSRKHTMNDDDCSQSPAVRFLCLKTDIKDGKWEALLPDRPNNNQVPRGSVLVVDRNRKDLDVANIQAMVETIEKQVVPLMTEECAQSANGSEEVNAAVRAIFA